MLIGFPNYSKDSIHTSIAAEIAGVAEKATPVSADFLLIEDSADGNEKKRLQIGSISHSLLSDTGSNSHATIDSHIGNSALHFTQASIATLGTITSGVWNGTALGADYVPNHDSLNGFVANEHIDCTAATSRLKTELPTEQMRLGYNSSIYSSFQTDSSGYLNISPTGLNTLLNSSITALTTTENTKIAARANNSAKTAFFEMRADGDPVMQFLMFGSAYGGTLFGQSQNKLAAIITTSYSSAQPSAFVIGNYWNIPLIFGVNSTEYMRIAAGGGIFFANLPTTEPTTAGQMWSDAGTLKISQ